MNLAIRVWANRKKERVMRSIARVVNGRRVSDGAGVDIRRVIGVPGADYVDPFLMFDDFRNDDPSGYVAGFPPHPHRGFETVTYMLKGKMRHRDSNGNAGLLEDGAVQWMTAGRGILHSEMPEQTDGSLWGFQIWLNLPQRLQMADPGYQDIPGSEITEFAKDGVDYRLVAGELFGHKGPAETHLPVLMVDVAPNGGQTTIPLTDGETTILFCFEGELSVAGEAIEDGDMAVLEGAGGVLIEGAGRGLLLSSAPLNEPIARHGPFVLSTEGELKKAFMDYQLGQLAPNQAEFLASGGRG
jgi:redox-sensitive bicupin YhaK (pirin superfamily)